jgi:hypothetical protein
MLLAVSARASREPSRDEMQRAASSCICLQRFADDISNLIRRR